MKKVLPLGLGPRMQKSGGHVQVGYDEIRSPDLVGGDADGADSAELLIVPHQILVPPFLRQQQRTR